MKIKLTYEFDNMADFQAYMDGIGTERAAEIATDPIGNDSPLRRHTVAELPDTEAAAAELPDTKAAAAEPEITATVDSDGLPYDPEIHATPKSFTADGQWRSKRGKSKEALDARAAFKASGGAVVTEAAPPVTRAMPMPAAAPAPVTYDALYNKTVSMMDRGVIDYDGVVALYAKVGLTDPSVLETNETMRAELFKALTEIEA
jgi:hypothetical protein